VNEVVVVVPVVVVSPFSCSSCTSYWFMLGSRRDQYVVV